MKQLLIIITILASTACFGQSKAFDNVKKYNAIQAKKDSIVKLDSVAKLTADTPLLTLSDLDKVSLVLDEKLLGKDCKIVEQVLQAAIVEAEKRRNKPKK